MSTISSGRRNKFLGAVGMFVMMSMSLLIPQMQVHAIGAPTIWWPTNGAKVSGVQPFKALLENQPVASYKMYWQVDNGQLNLMQDSNTDYPHKEASVDLSSWNWKGSGPYAINFVAKDLNDNPISQQSVSVYIDGQTSTQATQTNQVSSPTQTTQTTQTASTSVTQQNQPVTVPSVTTVQAPATIQTVTQTAPYTISISLPLSGSYISGTQIIRAQVQNLASSKYDMFWQVDGGSLNQMGLGSQGYYESQIDFSGWTWKGQGPYTINFVAKDSKGNILVQQSLNIMTGAQSQTASQTPTQTAPTPTQTQTYSVSISNPITSAAGTQTIAAQVNGLSTSQYSMYWQVDNGGLNAMQTSGQAYSATIDFSGWTWKGQGPYTINFVAKDPSGTLIAQKSMDVYTASQGAAQQTASTSPTSSPTVTTTPTAQPVQAPTLSNNPLAGAKLWVNPYSDAANYIKRTDISDYQRQMMSKVAQGAETQWFSTGWISDMYSAINNYVTTATNQGSVPTMVLYDIPYRDCGQYSAGGSDGSTYMNTVNSFAAGIGSRKAAVVLEPDALALTSCLNSTQLQQRYDLLKYAVQKLKSNPNTAVYLDIGHPNWLSVSDAAQKLSQAGVQYANGFALNTSNFNTDQENSSYGTQISQALANMGISDKHFVVDRGRNGNGSNGEWCNPSGRALGQLPTTNTGNALIDAFLWVKGPGGSDGNCNGGPSAGTFWPDYAIGLAAAAHW